MRYLIDLMIKILKHSISQIVQVIRRVRSYMPKAYRAQAHIDTRRTSNNLHDMRNAVL